MALMAITLPSQPLGLVLTPIIEIDEPWDRLRPKRRCEVPASGG